MTEEQMNHAEFVRTTIIELSAPLQRFLRSNCNPHDLITINSDVVTLHSADCFIPAKDMLYTESNDHDIQLPLNEAEE